MIDIERWVVSRVEFCLIEKFIKNWFNFFNTKLSPSQFYQRITKSQRIFIFYLRWGSRKKIEKAFAAGRYYFIEASELEKYVNPPTLCSGWSLLVCMLGQGRMGEYGVRWSLRWWDWLQLHLSHKSHCRSVWMMETHFIQRSRIPFSLLFDSNPLEYFCFTINLMLFFSSTSLYSCESVAS